MKNFNKFFLKKYKQNAVLYSNLGLTHTLFGIKI